jgi:hypothetical protein
MRALAIILAAATAILALTTAHYARELGRVRNQERAPAAAVTAGSVDAPTRADVATPPRSPATESGTTTAEARRPLPPWHREFLADMRDPVKRRNRVERQKSSIRQQSPYLADYLQLGDSRFDAFLDLVASMQVGQQERTLLCGQQPGCQDFPSDEAQREALIQEVAREFGIRKAERYEHYLLTSIERQHVSQMRGQLPDLERLGDARAEALIDALAAERVRIGEEIEARSQIAGITLDEVPFVLGPDLTMSALMEQAEEYFRRMRLRAAPLLSPAQLEAYDRMQNERLRRLPYMLKGVVPDGAAP